MGDTRVHPTTIDIDPPLPPPENDHPQPPIPAPPSKPVPPPPATYVVQFPREQILRYPPPENAKKFHSLTRRRNRRSFCRRCCCFTLCLLLLLLAVAAAASAGVLYLVFRFRSPRYSVTGLAVRGMNLTSAAFVSPGFDVTLRVENPNGKVGIRYLNGSSVNVFYNDVRLGDGVLPAFNQPRRNVTVLRTELRGSDVVLGGAVRTALRNAENQRRVPFVVRTRVPVRIEVGSVTTWKIMVRVRCDVVVDALHERANVVSNDCDYGVRLW